MSEENMGKVVPFKASVSRMRRGAEAYRRRGKMVEAIELLHQAARREDSARAWFQLGRQLRQVECYEEAAEMLSRALAWEDCPKEVLLELSRAMQALGRWDAAVSCLVNDLHYDPYSAVAAELRNIMMETDPLTYADFREPYRLNKLVQRAGRAYGRGQTALGERRYRRALRLTMRRAPIYRSLGRSRMDAGLERAAVRALEKALAAENENVQIMTMMAQCYDLLDQGSLAQAMMARSVAHCKTPLDEQSIMETWISLGDFRHQQAFLERRLKRHPYRIALMHPLADALWILGDEESARRWWRRIQSINPEDMRARAMLAWAQRHSGEPLIPAGLLPAEEREWLGRTVMLGMMGMDIEKLDNREQLELALRWVLREQNLEGQMMMVRGLTLEDRPWARRRLREVLASAGALPEAKRMALDGLTAWGDDSAKYVNMGGYVLLTEKDEAAQKPKGLWRMFASALLREAGQSAYRDDLLKFAREVWRSLSRDQRQHAAFYHRQRWVTALELYYLRLHGMNDEEDGLMRKMEISPRKVERTVRSLARRTHLLMEGEHTS